METARTVKKFKNQKGVARFIFQGSIGARDTPSGDQYFAIVFCFLVMSNFDILNILSINVTFQ